MGKIYHVSLAPFLIYPEGKYYEDQFVTYRVFYEAGNAIVYEDANDYYYTVDRTTSICKTKDAKILDSLDARKEIVAFAHAQNLPRIEELADQLYYGSLIGDTATFILENQPDHLPTKCCSVLFKNAGKRLFHRTHCQPQKSQ